ncbi:Uncharacterised protein [Mycobacteroides abscessus subsp. abscessus]|nr:Uncharacterised protein [Mycobacteroides abscessus subsp. abscessus]
MDVDGALRAVEREQHDAGHDGRQREGQIDEGVDHALAGELVADQHPGDQRAHHHVDQRDHHRDEHGDAQRVQRRGGGDRVPEAAPAVLEGGDGERGQWQQHDDAQPQHRGGDAERAHRPGDPQPRQRRARRFSGDAGTEGGRAHLGTGATAVTHSARVSRIDPATWWRFTWWRCRRSPRCCRSPARTAASPPASSRRGRRWSTASPGSGSRR